MTDLGGLGDVAGPDGTVVVGESDDISPKPILHKESREQVGIVGRGSDFKLGKPVLRDRMHLMFDAGVRLESLLVARQIVGQVEVGSHGDRFGCESNSSIAR
jgi:hypothetical protein